MNDGATIMPHTSKCQGEFSPLPVAAVQGEAHCPTVLTA